jgi:hypothetical protein
MLGIEIICSDEACAEVSEVVIASLDALEVLTCEGCGCVVQPLAVWEVVEIELPARSVELLPLAA